MKYAKILLPIIGILFGFSLSSIAQVTVTGTVTDAESGETLPGVNIAVKGMTIGTSTDGEGAYSLSVPSAGETLVFSFVGYESTQIPVNGRSTIDVGLTSNIRELEDLVVIGYGTQQKEDNTGSVTSITAGDFREGSITSPEELFMGKVAGVNVTPNDGAPGSGAVIRIRGGSSLSASNEPLYVVDGIPIEEGAVAGMRNPLNTINPNDIESITILKDASATAIYGSRASSGVVIINTKKGKKGQDLTVDYTGKVSLLTNPNQVEVFSADEFRQVITDNFGESAQALLGNDNTDWQDKIYDNTLSQEQNISLTGAFNQLPYRLSVGFSGNSGILNTSQMDRLTGSLNLTPSFFDDKLNVDFNLKGMRVENDFANRGAIGSALNFDPTKPVRVDNEDAPFDGFFAWVNRDTLDSGEVVTTPIGLAPANPVALLEQTRDQSTVFRSIGNIKFNYLLPFEPQINANLSLGFDYSDVKNGLFTIPDNAAFSFNPTSPVLSGVRRTYDQRKENELLDFYLETKQDLSGIQSTIDLTAGYSWEHHYEEGVSFETNFNTTDTTAVRQDTDFKTEYYIISTFGRMNYALKDKYLLTATLRYDGTSRFSEDNRWGPFPSFAAAWKIHEESFMQNSGTLSQLKLRLGYGVTGQQRIGQGDYPYLARFTASQPNAQYLFGDQFINTLRPEGFNANLRWEESTTYNIGLDYGLFDERISGSFEAFHRETTDLLNVVPVPAGTNFTNRIISNVGNLEIQGLEFDITGRPISNRNMSWEVGFNATYTTNEITKLTTSDSPDFIGVETGGIAGGVGNTIQIHSVGFPRNSFFVLEQVYDENGNPIEGLYVDRNDDGIINDDDKYRHENPTPDYTLGISSRFNYKRWDASFSGRANIGNHVYNNVASNSYISAMQAPQGFLSNTTTAVRETGFVNAQFFSDHFVENASFFRMDNITLGYSVSNLLNRNISMRISGTVQNAFVITDYSGLDPEVFGGIDNNIYPRPRTYVLGLNFTF